MAKLEEIKSRALVGGIVPSRAVEVVSAEWIGDDAINILFRGDDGVEETIRYRDDEGGLTVEQREREWSFDADGGHLRLVTEANRIKLAHHFDPYLAIHTSLVEPLPHQITAVYGEMLPRQPLRFLLADDPGAGKTIMAGLLIKELIARSEIERCMVVAPGCLVEQWDDELRGKFAINFKILSREMIENSPSRNVFNDHNYLIARLDVLARNENLQKQLMMSTEWDLVVCDEAHRMSARYYGSEVKYTKRYQLGQLLGQMCRNLLMMTATPHNGKEQDFQLFLALLDGDRFEGCFRDGSHVADSGDLMRRLTKEELRKFDGTALFPERCAYTAKYELSPDERALYEEVTNYVRTEMNRPQRFSAEDGKKKNNVGFALQILQRRLASSPAAIFKSLQRRRERLENELAEARVSRSGARTGFVDLELPDSDEMLFNLDEFGQDEIDEIEDQISARATNAETIQQLEEEVRTLLRLEIMAKEVLHSGNDTKWKELNRILDYDLMNDGMGNRRKLIIFTEAKDTLDYLAHRVRNQIGKAEAVEVIHGGVRRDQRANVVERFMQDRDLVILIANDAAGEGVNLQRGHLMVNYDLPWNPNKIEQRFGRIHRIGQTEVCHLWNLVAANTREGDVYARLLEKLEIARESLGGRVYDVLGDLFEGTPLRDLLVEAIRYGEQDHVKEGLFEKVDGAVDQDHLRRLIESRSLTGEVMPEKKVHEIRLEMERAEAERLQPHHIESFFIDAFRHLGGQIRPREEGRFEITHVPLLVRERSDHLGRGAPVQKKYERICFSKDGINQQPVASFICPGHPLLESVIGVIRDKYDHLMKLGAIMVDDSEMGEEIKALFLMEHSVHDGRRTPTGKPHLVSQRLQFVLIDQAGEPSSAGSAPHLNYRPATQDEVECVKDLLSGEWLGSNPEKAAIRFATEDVARRHLTEVKERRLPEIEKVEEEVKTRLTKEINHWDRRANEMKNEERAGKRNKMNWQRAERRAGELAVRKRRRLEELERERYISAQPPRIRGGMIVVPGNLLVSRASALVTPSTRLECSQDPVARREIEIAAMCAVMKKERAIGNKPVDVSAEKRGYDIESFDPKANQYRFIEVKGRVDGAKTVSITRNEIVASLNQPKKFILVIVEVENGSAGKPRYVPGALDTRGHPPFDQSSVTFSIKGLLEREEEAQDCLRSIQLAPMPSIRGGA